MELTVPFGLKNNLNHLVIYFPCSEFPYDSLPYDSSSAFSSRPLAPKILAFTATHHHYVSQHIGVTQRWQ